MGIGTTNPGYKLEVNGNTNIVIYSSGTFGATNSPYYCTKFIDGTMILRMNYTGNMTTAGFTSFTLPVTFFDNCYTASFMWDYMTSNNSDTVITDSSQNTSSAFYIRTTNNIYSTNNGHVHITLIGRWK